MAKVSDDQIAQPYAGSTAEVMQNLHPVSTTDELSDSLQPINTQDKRVGKMVYNRDTAEVVWASGEDPTDGWQSADGEPRITPAPGGN